MITKELTETATEVNIVFENLSSDVLAKIPMNIREFFKKIASNSYQFEYDKNKTLNEQDLKPKTKGILALLYRDYICDEAEKQEYIKEYNQFKEKQEQAKREKYNPEDLFKTPKNEIQYNEILPVVYEKNRWYTKFLNLVKRIFKK